MSSKKRGTLVLYTGSSGVGKGTIMQELLKRDNNIRLSVSNTTRAPRDGEIDGVHYNFVTREQFEKLMNYAKKGIKSYNKRIKSGDIKVMPSKDNNELACRWCGMAEICLFDKDRDEVRPLCQNVDTAWQIIDENS